jgi:hypothetical protein
MIRDYTFEQNKIYLKQMPQTANAANSKCRKQQMPQTANAALFSIY